MYLCPSVPIGGTYILPLITLIYTEPRIYVSCFRVHPCLLADRPFPAKGSVLTQMPQADAGAVRSSAGQNRHPRPEGERFEERFEEH